MADNESPESQTLVEKLIDHAREIDGDVHDVAVILGAVNPDELATDELRAKWQTALDKVQRADERGDQVVAWLEQLPVLREKFTGAFARLREWFDGRAARKAARKAARGQ